MAHQPDHSASPERRRALVIMVNTAAAVIGGALSALLGIFALKPIAAASGERWVRAGSLGDLEADTPATRVLVVSRVDGWYRERAPQTVFLVWDGDKQVRAMSATCTHLGCQVRWEAEKKHFLCPCHGGIYDVTGKVTAGPPPRPLDPIDARIDPADDTILVRL
jgi:menaquinol-cytochrome c reductase iron-sulfur subunit